MFSLLNKIICADICALPNRNGVFNESRQVNLQPLLFHKYIYTKCTCKASAMESDDRKTTDLRGFHFHDQVVAVEKCSQTYKT